MRKSTLCITAILTVVLFIAGPADAGGDPNDNSDPNVVRTTMDFGPPMPFGTAGQGAIFPGKLYAGREVVAVRIYWDIVVAEGYDAAEIIANMHLPILSDPEHLVKIPLDGTVLGWSGSGTFSYHEVTDKYNFKFGPEWTGYDWWFTGPWDPSDPLVEMWPLDAVEVLPSSHIEIDYLIPCRYTLPGDVDKDCKVDLVDFALLAASWLADCVINPGDPACIPRE